MLNWSEVVSELDHPGFAVKDRQGLILLTRALLMGLRDVPFPIALMYTPWTNKDGQVIFRPKFFSFGVEMFFLFSCFGFNKFYEIPTFFVSWIIRIGSYKRAKS